MLQLVNDRVHMYNPVKEDMWYDAETTEQFMGVKPPQVSDLLALMGDSVDNIPGAPGIGEKGARDLIQRFGSVEGALEHAAEVERKTYRESLQNNRDQILLSKKLATIDTSVPIEFKLEDMVAAEPDIAELKKIYKELEFYSLLKEAAPTEDAHTRDYATIATREDAAAYAATLAALDPATPIAFAFQSSLERRSAAHHDRRRVSSRSRARAFLRLSGRAEADPRRSAAHQSGARRQGPDARAGETRNRAAGLPARRDAVFVSAVLGSRGLRAAKFWRNAISIANWAPRRNSTPISPSLSRSA